ncbi:MAG: hypothetical protein KA821_06445 [Chitinophagaceae bacterium]|nr:hypothetical protein [Chitinophagaceae bacterium]
MKKILILLPLMLAATIVGFAAGPVPASDPAVQSFSRQFAGAQNVSWSNGEDGLQRVTFVWAGHRAQAYFSAAGEFLGAMRGLFYQQLPLSVIRAVDKRYNNPIVLEARELSNQEGTTYSLLIEYRSKRMRVKLNGDGGFESAERVK